MTTSVAKFLLTMCAVVAFAALPAWAFDGQQIPIRYDGFLAATQENGTQWGDHKVVVGEEGYLVGSELDSLYVCADGTDLWIGIPGNLPNRFASSQSFVILIDADASTPPNPNILSTAWVDPFGGGASVLRYLDGTILEQGFHPETAIVVNRFAETTYVDSWYLDPPQAKDQWYDDLVSLNPYNGRYLSAWMDTTNVNGVNAGPTPPDGTGPGTQGELAATAVKGLRLRLDRQYFYIGTEIKIMVLLASPGDNEGQPATYVSNQVLPPLQPGYAGTPGCLTPPWPVNYDETYEYPELSGLFGFSGPQFTTVPLVAGTPGAGGFDGSDIPGNWPTGSLVTTQQIHTCYGDVVWGTLPDYTIEGSELDQLFVRADDEYLHVAVTGNLEGNGNKVCIFIDADPAVGENTMGANSPLPPDATMIYGWMDRTFDDGFAPENVYIVNSSGGNLYADAFHLLLPDADVKQYQGYCPVNGTSDDWVDAVPPDGSNPNGNRFVLNHTNNYGVLSCYEPGSPGEAETATSGLEAMISLTELGLPAEACEIKVWVVLGGGDSVYLSNQSLPSFTYIPQLCESVGSYSPAPDNLPFDFGETTPTRGHPAFEGDQFAVVNLCGACCQEDGTCDVTTWGACMGTFLPGVACDPNPCMPEDTQCYLGDLNDDGEFDARDIQPFVNVLLGGDTDPTHLCAADVNGDEALDVSDVELLADALVLAGTDDMVFLEATVKTCATKRWLIAKTGATGKDVIISGSANGLLSDCPVKAQRRATGGANVGPECDIPAGGAKRLTMAPNQELRVWCSANPGNCRISINPKPKMPAQPGEQICP